MSQNEIPAYPCRCNGCRRQRIGWYQGMNAWTFMDYTKRGNSRHYWSDEARRFFRSRLLGLRVIDGGVIATESKGAGFDVKDGRTYVAVLWCPYGTGHHEGTDYASARKVSAFLHSEEAAQWARTVMAGCFCHGCTIDRAEASAEPVTVTA